MSARSQPRTPASIASTWGRVASARKAARRPAARPRGARHREPGGCSGRAPGPGRTPEKPLRSAFVMATPSWSGGPANARADPPCAETGRRHTGRRTCPQVPRGTPGRRGGHLRPLSEAPPVLRCRPWTARSPRDRRLLSAEMLSIGTELTVGETRDTNAGELARSLTEAGVRVGRLTALPDDLEAVDRRLPDRPRAGRPRRLDRRPRADAGRPHPRGDRGGLRRDTGGRSGARAWLRGLWDRRGMPFPAINLKQAWLHPVGRGARRTRTARRRAGGSTGPTGGSSSRCPARLARCARCGTTRSCRGCGRGGSAPIASSAPAPHRHRRIDVADRLGEAILRGDEPGRRDLCPGRRRGRPDVGGRDGPDGGRRRPSSLPSCSTRSSRSSWPPSASTSGRVAARPGPRRSTPSSSDLGLDRWRCSRSGRAGRSAPARGPCRG